MEFSDATVPEMDDIPETEPPTDPVAPFGYTPTGRIRKRPVGGSKGTSRGPTSIARNERLATQATAVIMDLNDYAMLGTSMVGMIETAGVISARQQQFRERVYAALLLDPALAEQITRAGVKSGKLMLIIAIVTHLIAIAPTAVVELRALRENREDAE